MLPEVLKKERNKKGLSQMALSKILGISQQTIGSWETGRTSPDLVSLTKLSTLFDISTDYLLGMTNIPDTAENYKKKISPAQDLLSVEDRELLNKYHRLPEKVRNKIEARIEVAYEDMLEKENEVNHAY